ncbi:MAG: SprT-like domain-containing protein [Planctomycetota bacterium]
MTESVSTTLATPRIEIQLRAIMTARVINDWPARLGSRPSMVSFEYYDYAAFENKIWRKRGTLVIKLHRLLRTQPADVQCAFLRLLLDKLFRVPSSVEDESIYRQCIRDLNLDAWYAEQAEKKLARAVRSPGRQDTKGEHYDLDESFERVNQRYFNGTMQRPATIGWSPRRAQRRVGCYFHKEDRLMVSRILDDARTPVEILDYVMYHELLHKKYVVYKGIGGRTVYHSPEFREAERLYPDFRAIDRRLNELIRELGR